MDNNKINGHQTIEIRRETEQDYFATEAMVRRAFWNKYRPGCDEHLMVRAMRSHPDFLPEFSRVAVCGDRIVGLINYFKCKVLYEGKEITVPSFGPLCADHAYKNRGIGRRLITETLPLLKAAGYPGVIIFGEPDYYPKLGFVRAGSLGLTDMEGNAWDAFLAYEFEPGSLRMPGGKFVESTLCEAFPHEEPNPSEPDRPFEKLPVAVRPCQWTYDNATEEKNGYRLMYAVENPRAFDFLFARYIDELSRYDESLTRHNPAAMVRELRADPNKATYIIVKHGAPVGLLVTSVPGSGDEADDCTAYLEEIWILPENRGQGIAKDIFLRFLRQQSGDTGFCVIPSNPAAEMWRGLLKKESYSFTENRSDEGLIFFRVLPRTLSDKYGRFFTANYMMGPNALLLLDALVKQDPAAVHGNVMDLGCGEGLTTVYLAKETAAEKVYAVDLWIPATENMKRFRENGIADKAVPIHADALDRTFPDDFFDALVSIDAYHYFGTADGVFGEKTLPLVRQGGTVLLAVPGLAREMTQEENALMTEWADDEAYMFRTAEWWQAHLEKESAGKASVSVVTVPDPEPFWKDWYSTGHEYALRDREFLERGLGRVITFILMTVKKN
ncbi:MAG: GNAT family N-acetyltransferase [Clostridia bacterium]|nr:GNAT family N-acetyltransferase [Clostridia bacterium]